jgi:signal transduction histidine kinase
MLREPFTPGRPLSEAVSSLAEECAASGVETQFVMSGAPQPLSPPVELALYRAAQEALTNVRRHARATRANLRLSFDGNTVRLAIEDDGIGADETQGGFGLLGVRERVALLGGSFTVKTATGQGFAMEVCLPT